MSKILPEQALQQAQAIRDRINARRKAAHPNQQSIAANPDLPRTAAPQASPLALLVEDDQDIAMLVEFILKRDGYRVDRCDDGRAAQRRIVDGPVPDLVILDVMLPYVDGFELVGNIRIRPEWANVPVLMLTSRGSERDISRALDSGATDYMVKPFQHEELKARLRRMRRDRL